MPARAGALVLFRSEIFVDHHSAHPQPTNKTINLRDDVQKYDIPNKLGETRTIDTQQLNAEPATGAGMNYALYLVRTPPPPVRRLPVAKIGNGKNWDCVRFTM